MKWPEKIRVMQLKKRRGSTPARTPSEMSILDPSDEEFDDEDIRIYVPEKKLSKKTKKKGKRSCP